MWEYQSWPFQLHVQVPSFYSEPFLVFLAYIFIKKTFPLSSLALHRYLLNTTFNNKPINKTEVLQVKNYFCNFFTFYDSLRESFHKAAWHKDIIKKLSAGADLTAVEPVTHLMTARR